MNSTQNAENLSKLPIQMWETMSYSGPIQLDQAAATQPAPPPLAPIQQSERIGSIDVLRGIAVLGILLMNIQSFSMIGAAYFNPMCAGEPTPANWWTWAIVHVIADQKFMTIFSMLFGAGLVVGGERAKAARRPWILAHYRRMVALMLIGVAHAYLLWYGDILFLYAICGMVLVWCRNWRPRTLLICGCIVIAIGSGISIFHGLSVPFWTQHEREEVAAAFEPDEQDIEQEIEDYQGSWRQQNGNRWPVARYSQTWLNLEWGIWRAGGLMLAGMALFKWGVFSATRSRRFYLMLIVAAVLMGYPLVIRGVIGFIRHDYEPLYLMFLGIQFNYWGSLFVALGYVGAVMLLCQAFVGRAPLRILSNVGRMALSNYLLETIICTLIFYGHGLGYFGEVSRVQQLWVVFGIWILLLVFSSLWLARFRYGPFEWLWRCVTYWKWQPLRLN